MGLKNKSSSALGLLRFFVLRNSSTFDIKSKTSRYVACLSLITGFSRSSALIELRNSCLRIFFRWPSGMLGYARTTRLCSACKYPLTVSVLGLWRHVFRIYRKSFWVLLSLNRSLISFRISFRVYLLLCGMEARISAAPPSRKALRYLNFSSSSFPNPIFLQLNMISLRQSRQSFHWDSLWMSSFYAPPAHLGVLSRILRRAMRSSPTRLANSMKLDPSSLLQSL